MGREAAAALKAAVFFCSHHTGHLNPMLTLVEVLCARGVTVHFFAPGECRTVIENAGAIFHRHRDLKELALEQVAQLGCTPSDGLQKEFFFEQILPVTVALMKGGLREEVAALQPDLLVADTSCYWGMLVAQLLGLPCVSSCSCSVLTPEEKDAFHGFLRKIDYIQRSVEWLKAEYGVEYDAANSFFNLTDFTVVWSIEDFASSGSFHDGPPESPLNFFGASIPADYDKESSPPDAQLQDEVLEIVRRARNAPGSLIVYCSMGTVFGQEPWTRSSELQPDGGSAGGGGGGDMLHTFLRRVFLALGGKPAVTCVVSCGRRRSVESLGEIPSNFVVRQCVNQKQLLKLASVFITHGGNNSLHESLFAATPLLVIPLWGDQHVNAKHVVDKALGSAILSPFAPGPVKDLEHAQPEGIWEAVYDIAVTRKAEITAACQRMQQRLRKKHSYLHTEAVDDLEAFVRREVPIAS